MLDAIGDGDAAAEVKRGLLRFLLLLLGALAFLAMGYVAGRHIERKALEGRIEMEGTWLARYSGGEKVSPELDTLCAEIEAQQGLRIQSRWIKAEAAGSDLKFICTESAAGRNLVVKNDQSVGWRECAALHGR
ncbi:hypothetical protein [Haloferula sp. BvORR071]|uniref:hypothetical protein n=1 Tax=Haloferula sp. BvORR071 TaxID=1396141 RepID=UPI000552C5EE|nr:hypothetical protein [Haloferula sp. BvORR071]